jgi:hypothetical protein
MLQLRDAELELLVVPARYDPELLEEPIERGTASLSHAAGFALPAQRQLFDRLASLVPAHAAPCGKLVGQRIGPLCRQRNRAERGETELLD